MKVRKSNFELLRIIAIFYIVTVHYMTKGNVVDRIYNDTSLTNIAYALVEHFVMVCCNLFVLITGYFMVDAKWNPKKIIGIVAEVLFYSLVIPIILGAFGVIDMNSLSFGQLTTIMLPIEFEHYWYVTAYVGLFMISPVLAAAVNNLPEKTLRYSILGLLVIYGGFKSVNPYQIPWDRYGEDIPWFICMYLVAGYIKKHGIPFMNSFRRCFGLYIAATLGGFLIKLAASMVMVKTGKMWYYADMTTSHNYAALFIASVSLFYAFTYLDFSNKWINLIGAHTFGIYLLHNNILIDNKWMHWLGIDYAYGKWWQPIHMIIAVIIVIIVGTIVDIFRAEIFALFTKKNA